MGIRDVINSAGQAIDKAADATVAAGKSAASWTADKAKAGYNVVRKQVVKGKLWVEGAGAAALEWKGWVDNEDFPAVTNYDVMDNAGPPMPASGAWATPGGPSRLSPAERGFLYLDVGRWGGSTFYPKQRDFGLVCGRTAVLCAFRFDKGNAPPIPNDFNRPEIDHLNALLNHLSTGSLGGVKVRRWDISRTLLPNNADAPANKIFVILGDMHLPSVTSMGDTFGKRLGRQPGSDGSSGDMIINDAIDWYRSYNGADGSGVHDRKGADIFEEAGPDLTEFVRLLNGFTGHPLHLLQLGDMIDLWIGLECFFLKNPSTVVLNPEKSDPDPITFIDTWTNRTLTKTTQSTHVANFLAFSNGSKNWLYGNHDNYLARHNPPTLVSMSGNITRAREFDGGTLFAEHGHRWDSANRDGATFGQSVTQVAFSHPSVRSIEPSSRRDALLGVAGYFLSRESQPFVVYAMGHTHVPLLTRIVVRNNT